MTFHLLQDQTVAHRRGIHMYGDYVTRSVWDEVNMIMNDCYMESPAYKARNWCAAFFQGGCHAPDGKFIFIEFWNADRAEGFIKLFNERVGAKIAPVLTELHVDMYAFEERGALDYCLMIAEDTDCEYDASGAGTPFRFKPENNIQHYEVYKLIKTIGLTLIKR